MDAENFKCTIRKDRIVHIFGIYTIVAHISQLGSGPAHILSYKEGPE